jgi:hypothetical protein
MLSTPVCGFLFSTPLEGKGHERQELHGRTLALYGRERYMTPRRLSTIDLVTL